MQQTSLLAYENMRNSLAVRQRLVYDIIRVIGPCTDQECASALGKSDPNWIRPRRNELVKKGLIEDAGKRQCSITKKKAIVWRKTK